MVRNFLITLTRGLAAFWRGLHTCQLFLRLAAFGFAALLPLLGRATVSPHLPVHEMWGLIGVALAFHIFSYVLNDVVDLPLDRTQPARANYPLVQGIIGPGPALALALLQIPFALLITIWLGGNAPAYLALTAAFVLMAIYDLFGKRAFLPPLTDVAQGLAWAALVLYGATITSGRLTMLTGIVFAFVVLFTVQVNGVPGSLRDLPNDLAWDRRTTAIWLGVRPQADATLLIPRRFIGYALGLQFLISGLTWLPLARNDFRYSAVIWVVELLAVLAISGICLHLLLVTLRPNNSRRTLIGAFTLYIFLSLSVWVVLLGPYLERDLLLVLGLVCIGPLLLQRWWYGAWRWAITSFAKTFGYAAPPALPKQ